MKGLEVKYDVYKVGSGEKIYDCFVLRPDRDRAARAALTIYAYVTQNENLARDIREWLLKIENTDKK